MPVIIHQHRLNSAAIHIAHRLQNSDHLFPVLSVPTDYAINGNHFPCSFHSPYSEVISARCAVRTANGACFAS